MDVTPPLTPASSESGSAPRIIRPSAAPPAEDPGTGPPPEAPSPSWAPSSALKFRLTAADVDARFEIDAETSRVTVTMYDHRTGQVIHEIPSRRVRDVIGSITVNGLQVDATS